MKKSTVIKTVIWAVVLVIIDIVTKTFGAIVGNAVAINQMQIDDSSYALQQLYATIIGYAPFVIAILILLTYAKEISKLIKYIRRKIHEAN